MTTVAHRPSGPLTHFVGSANYERLLRQLAACNPADRAVARTSPAVEQMRVEWLTRMGLAFDAYDDGLNARAAGYLRQAAERLYAAADATAECAGALEARDDDPVANDLRHPSTASAPSPRRTVASCQQLELVA